MGLASELWGAIKESVAADERPAYRALQAALGEVEKQSRHLPVMERLISDVTTAALQPQVEQMVAARMHYEKLRVDSWHQKLAAWRSELERFQADHERRVAEFTQEQIAWRAQDDRTRFAQAQLSVLNEEMRSGSPYKEGTRAQCIRSIGLITAAALGWTGAASGHGEAKP